MPGGKILIVDDESDTREMLGTYLNVAGYQVAFANNGWEALLELDRAAADLILLDVMMPGMDGVTFLRILRGAAQQKATPVLLVTALTEQDALKRIKGLDVQGILPKTQRLLDDLVERVHQVLSPDEPEPNLPQFPPDAFGKGN